LWLHAQESEAAKNPAMVVWYSNSFKLKYPEKVNNLISNKDNFFSTDIIYHSLLDLIELEHVSVTKSESIFSAHKKDIE